MSEQSPRRYSQEEVNAILQRALERQGPAGGLTHDELMETAQELGIDPNQLSAAIDEHAATAGIEQARETWKARRKQKFFEHLKAYMIVNGFLVLMNVFAGDGVNWAIFPILGWGIGLAFDAADAFYPNEKKVERGAQRLLARQRREEWKEIGRSFKRSFKVDHRPGKIVIQKGDKRIEIG